MLPGLFTKQAWVTDLFIHSHLQILEADWIFNWYIQLMDAAFMQSNFGILWIGAPDTV
jgi:hypothetical protein